MKSQNTTNMSYAVYVVFSSVSEYWVATSCLGTSSSINPFPALAVKLSFIAVTGAFYRPSPCNCLDYLHTVLEGPSMHSRFFPVVISLTLGM